MLHGTVLVVEDNESWQDFYWNFFEVANRGRFSWRLAASAEKALDFLARNRAEVVILDWNLPRMSGLEALRRIRASPLSRRVPVLMVTARTASKDVVAGLEAGADDYLRKPFDSDELSARLRCLIRRSEQEGEGPRVFKLEGLQLDVGTGDVAIEGRPIHLEPKQAEILAILLRRPIIHSPRNLWDMAWGYESKRWKHTVVAHISALKKRLGGWGRRLESHYGKGYRLNNGVPVQRE